MWKIAIAPIDSGTDNAKRGSESCPASFLLGLGPGIANPKAFAAIGAVYACHSSVPVQTGLDAALKVAALTGMTIVANTAWLVFGSIFVRSLTNPFIGRVINIFFAFLLNRRGNWHRTHARSSLSRL